MSIGAKVVVGCHVPFGVNLSFVLLLSDAKRRSVLLYLILIELWKVRLGDGAAATTEAMARLSNQHARRVRSPDRRGRISRGVFARWRSATARPNPLAVLLALIITVLLLVAFT